MSWTTPRTWVATSETTTSTMFNEQIRDNLLWMGGGANGWTAFTPTWTSASNPQPAIGNGTLAGSYALIGMLCVFDARMTLGSTSTFGTGNYSWATPITNGQAARSEGRGMIVDSGTATWRCFLETPVTSTFALYYGATARGRANPTSPMTWASGDSFRVFGLMESA